MFFSVKDFPFNSGCKCWPQETGAPYQDTEIISWALKIRLVLEVALPHVWAPLVHHHASSSHSHGPRTAPHPYPWPIHYMGLLLLQEGVGQSQLRFTQAQFLLEWVLLEETVHFVPPSSTAHPISAATTSHSVAQQAWRAGAQHSLASITTASLAAIISHGAVVSWPKARPAASITHSTIHTPW